jgi:hypothetical protein
MGRRSLLIWGPTSSGSPRMGPEPPRRSSQAGASRALGHQTEICLFSINTMRLPGRTFGFCRSRTEKSRVFLQAPASRRGGVFSPDGQWIAYVSNSRSRYEVFIRPFPGPGAKGQVSTEGGTNPVWARSGREIFYRSEDKMMAVAVEAQPPRPFETEAPFRKTVAR